MAYCSACGVQLPEDALFCPKCGKKVTPTPENTATPSDEMREALTKMSAEMEKAFNIAAKQIQDAFKTAKENVQKNIKEPQICPNCQQKNLSTALYCAKCGQRLPEKQTRTTKTKDNNTDKTKDNNTT
ncbi:MAG: zinc-ribbon domain-containing protein [Candidatus Bathyarchaeota archaeon]|nr:zinc-ribbon domain-containing protein [Candidatus Bathyarchaeota archaeon]